MLYTASFYAPQNWVGAVYRVSRQHPRGRKTQWDILPFLYPDRDLLRAYRDSEIDFVGLGAAYLKGLDTKLADLPEFRDWLESAEDQGVVLAPEAEAVGKGDIHLLGPRFVRYVIQIAVRVWISVVDGGG